MTRLSTVFSVLLVAASVSLTASADPQWPELFRKAVSAPEREQMRYSYEQVTFDEGGNELYRVAYDPLKPEGSRFKLLFIHDDMKVDMTDLLAEIEADGDDVWCEDIADNVKGDVTLAADNGDKLTYSFTPTDPDAEGPQKKVLEQSDAILVVDQIGQMRSIQYNLAKPFKPVIVARVNRFNLFAQCAPTPEGRYYFSELDMDLELSVFGKDQIQKTRQLVQNLKLVGR